MRSDMKKVLTERPRRGGCYTYKDFRPRKCQGEYADDLPSNQGMRRPYGWETKEFSDLLGPLQRFLRGCVGRSWDDVWSEICTVVNGGSTVEQHLRGHVMSEVETHVTIPDPANAAALWAYGNHYRGFHEPYGLYVDPRDGILRFRDEPTKKSYDRIVVDGMTYERGDDGLLYPITRWHPRSRSGRYPLKVVGTQRAMHIDGIWYWMILDETPSPITVPYIDHGRPQTRVVYFPRYDMVTGEYVKEGRYHAGRRQMSSRDLRRHRLKNTRGD